MSGKCTDLRNKGTNSVVKVFRDGKLVRTERPTTIDDINQKNPHRVTVPIYERHVGIVR